MAQKIKKSRDIIEQLGRSRLQELEQKIGASWVTIARCLTEIKKDKLWVHSDCSSWGEYLYAMTGWTQHKFDKMRTSAEAWLVGERFGLTFKNEAAAREFRSQFWEWYKLGILDDFADLFVAQVEKVKQEFRVDHIQAKHILAVKDAIMALLNNPSNGNRSAFEAQVSLNVFDAIERQRGHIIANSRRQWNRAVFPRYQEWQKETASQWDEIMDAVINSSQSIEIRWSFVESVQ